MPFFDIVTASTVDVGAVLSQKVVMGKLHSYGFFYKASFLAERNYSSGDRKLLAIKLALEEWIHLLKGAYRPLFCNFWSVEGY